MFADRLRDFDLGPAAPEQERRLALANWMIDPKNPLTPRVIVNRLWHYHFGRGIVATPSDFGHMGFAPHAGAGSSLSSTTSSSTITV